MFIEQILIFGLGFLAALLLGLMVIPALNRRAMRLARRRIELQLPLSPAEILAERDQLRAEYAVAQRQTEQKFETAQTSRAEISGELGRRTSELVNLQNRHAEIETTLKTTSDQLASTQAELADLQAQTGAHHLALHDEAVRHDALRGNHANLRQSHIDLSNRFDDLTARLAGTELAKTGVELQAADLQRNLNESTQQIAAIQDENSLLRSEVSVARLSIENSAKAREKLQDSLAATQAEDADLRDRLAKTEATRKKTAAELADSRALNEVLQTNYDLQHNRHTVAMQDHVNANKNWQQQIENLKAEVAALEGALAAARNRARKSKPENAASAIGKDELQQLRNAISDIAATVLRKNATTPNGATILHDLAEQVQASRSKAARKTRSLADRILETEKQ